ncbi:MAG: ABC transporter permease [Bryobacteraceae bacterium]
MARLMQSRAFISTVSVLLFLLVWEVAPRLHLVEGFYTSQPSHVLAASLEILKSQSFARDVSVSLEEFVIGMALAVLIGIPIGLLLGSFQTLRYLLDPPVMAIYATPQLALIPIYVLWLGIGMQSKVAVVFVAAVIPIIVNSIAGVRQVDHSLVLVAQSFCAKKHDIFGKVILPASLPSIMIGVRLGMSRGILGVVVAEMYVSQDGVGNQILKLGSAFRVDHLLFYVLLVSAFGFAATSGVRKLEERLQR